MEMKINMKINNIISTELDLQDGQYTGRIKGDIVYGSIKAKIINTKYKNKEFSRSYAYADHYSDYDLLNMVSNPVLVNPDKKSQRYFEKNKIANLKII